MLNKEKYAKEILDIAVRGSAPGLRNGRPFACIVLGCSECECFQVDKDCSDIFFEWANSEYVEPPVDWSKVPIDTPVLARDFEYEKWHRRYFAGYENGKTYVWVCGATSWSSNPDDKVSCYLIKLAEEEKE